MNRVELTSIITAGPKESKNSRTSRTQDQRARQGRASASSRSSSGPGRRPHRPIRTSSTGSRGCWSSSRSSTSSCSPSTRRTVREKSRERMGAKKTGTGLSEQRQRNPLPLVDGLVLEVVGRRHHLSGWGIHGHYWFLAPAGAGERCSPGRKREREVVKAKNTDRKAQQPMREE